ncbi:hypothetical protein BDB00DRAFT_933813 [Zychaea mexicana]|uniref:uncharacterized protein n=1 Tax=Zychaea mexicana TaxID=64656 RepID=UPI0022FE8BF1|nr:uncharacterized protein BDB00DRAFT_933813 [Zychaea mexicana]KAI9482627.1 hypothetical protein BDB00DRAFT_933813 [Zychaea mexicana]
MTILLSKSSKSSELKLQRVKELWHRSKNALDANHCKTAINTLDAVIGEIEQNVLAIALLQKAKVLATQESFENAITALYRVMKLAPELAEGYLLAGQLLQTIDRRDVALRIYNKGVSALSLASSSSDNNNSNNVNGKQPFPEHLDLVQAKNALEQEIEHENTMVWKLPMELLSRIFIKGLTYKDRLQCSFTCRAWESIILDVLPRASPKVILSSMPKQSMNRLLTTLLNSDVDAALATAVAPTGDTEQSRRRRMYKISISSAIAPKSLRNILMALVNEQWKDRIETLEVLAGMDGVGPYIKQSFNMLLMQNRDSLRKVTLCGIRDTQAIRDVLQRNLNLEHLIAAAHHTLLPDNIIEEQDKELDDAMPRQTFSGKKIGDSDDSWMTKIAYGRNKILAHAQNLRLHVITRADNPAHRAEEIHRSELGPHLPQCQPIMGQYNLKRLELVGIEIYYFLTPTFWEQLPKLEHVAIKDPIDLPADYLKLAHILWKNCPKLKTFRYGDGWEAPLSEEEQRRGRRGRRRKQQQQQEEEKDGLIELFVRLRADSKDDNSDGRSLIHGMLTSHSSTLTVLVLELQVLSSNDGIDALVRISFPCLRELQIHNRWRKHGLDQAITETHVTTLGGNCPILDRIVINNVYMSMEALYALGNRQPPLHCIHLRLPADNARFHAAFDGQRFRRHRNNNRNGINNAVNNNNNERRTEITFNHVVQRSMTMITEACFSGEYLNDADLHTLTTCNHNCLSTIRFVACEFITADGITAALSQAKSLCHITFAQMPKLLRETMIADLSVELPYLEDLTFIGFKPNLMYLQAITMKALKNAVQTIAANRKSAIPLSIYFLPDLAVKETLLVECLLAPPDHQQQRCQAWIKSSTIQDISMARPIVDYI